MSGHRSGPPRFAAALMRKVLGEGPGATSIAGDLFEEHRVLTRERGLLRADAWYWGQLFLTGMGYARPGRASLERIAGDVRIALRGFRREPGFTLAVVLTLALGIGAGTAIFSVVDGVLLRPLPYERPTELVRVWASNEETGDPFSDFMYSDIEPLQGVESFQATGALSLAPRVMMDERGEDRANVLVARSTPTLFTTLGVEPVLGRMYNVADATDGARLLVISHELWERRFAASPDVIGRFVHLDTSGYEVIGVLPEGLAYPEGADAFRVLTPGEMEDDDREVHFVARLAPGVSPSVANAAVASAAASLAAATPESHRGMSAWIQPLQAMVVRDVRTALIALLGAVGLLLLITCVNTANLLLARATRGAHEIAVRTALGASRRRIVSQRLTESVLLAVVGGIAGLWVGRWILAFMLRVGPDIPRLAGVSLDARVVTVMLSVTALAGLLFGAGPAWHAARTPPERTLREGGTTATPGGTRSRFQSGLVATEIAVSTVLAVMALLLFTTFRNAVTHDRGFEFDQLVAITIDPMHPPEAGDESRAYFGEIVERVRALGGVRDASLSSHSILEPRGFRVPVSVEGTPRRTPIPTAHVNVVSDTYFATAGIAHLEGSGFSEDGGTDGEAELVVNERFVRQHLSEVEHVLGARVSLDWIGGRVVGVVRDVETELGAPALPKAYVSLERVTVPGMSLTVRTVGDPAAIVPAVRGEITAVDRDVLIEDIAVVGQSIRTSVAPQRFNMWLLVSFATLALVLAAVGIHGVTAYAVADRRNEIGIRRALGASDHTVAMYVARRVVTLTTIGVAIGLLASVSGADLVASLLVGVSPTEPWILLGVPTLLMMVAAGAAAAPVVRAVRVDPTEALRAD